MAASAVAPSTNYVNNISPSSSVYSPPKKDNVSSVLSYKDRSTELFQVFEESFLNNTDRTDIIRRRMALAQRLTCLLSEYSRDTRTMLLEGIALDFDFPLYLFDSMCELMIKSAKGTSQRLSKTLLESAGDAGKIVQQASSKSEAFRIESATKILKQITDIHQEMKRQIAEFGSFFQPLCTIPAGFFNLPAINIQKKFLNTIADHWGEVVSVVKKCIFAATDLERSVFHQSDAGQHPEAIKLRKNIADAITFWCRIQHEGDKLLQSSFIPDYLKDCETALARIGSKLSVKELLDITVIRIQNEQDRFFHLFKQDTTPVRRVVQLGLVKSQVQRISLDAEVGLNAALAQLPYAELFHKLVLMLDFEDRCIDTICDAIDRNIGSELSAYLARCSQSDDERESLIDMVASVYEKYRAAVASCQTKEQYKLQFYVAIRRGVNTGMGHAGMETTLAQHFHKLLKDGGALSPAEVQFLAFDLRAAVATFAPLLRDVDVFVRVSQHRLGSRLMSRKSPHPKLERFLVDELTGSIGPAYTHGMKSMIDQFASSQKQREERRRQLPKNSALPFSSYVPVSKYSWPSFSMLSQNTVTLHPTVLEMCNQEVKRFVQANPSSAPELKTSIHPLLSSVELRTGNNAGIFGNAVQCSMLLHIASSSAANGTEASELAEKLKITEPEVQWIGGTLVRSGVATNTNGRYKMIPIEADRRIVLSSVWGTASRSAAVGAKAIVGTKKVVGKTNTNKQNVNVNSKASASASSTQQEHQEQQHVDVNENEVDSDEEEAATAAGDCVIQ